MFVPGITAVGYEKRVCAMATLPLPTSLGYTDSNATLTLTRHSAASALARLRRNIRSSALQGTVDPSLILPSIRLHSRRRGSASSLLPRAGGGTDNASNENDDGPVSLGTAQLPPDVDVEKFDTLMYEVSACMITGSLSGAPWLMFAFCCRF